MKFEILSKLGVETFPWGDLRFGRIWYKQLKMKEDQICHLHKQTLSEWRFHLLYLDNTGFD